MSPVRRSLKVLSNFRNKLLLPALPESTRQDRRCLDVCKSSLDEQGIAINPNGPSLEASWAKGKIRGFYRNTIEEVSCSSNSCGYRGCSYLRYLRSQAIYGYPGSIRAVFAYC